MEKEIVIIVIIINTSIIMLLSQLLQQIIYNTFDTGIYVGERNWSQMVGTDFSNTAHLREV